MKDNMTGRRDEAFLKAKGTLDKTIKAVSALASKARKESRACCGEQELDARDQLSEVAALLLAAESNLEMARAKAGQINSGGMTRSGST